MYEIMLGGWENTASIIRYDRKQPDKVRNLRNSKSFIDYDVLLIFHQMKQLFSNLWCFVNSFFFALIQNKRKIESSGFVLKRWFCTDRCTWIRQICWTRTKRRSSRFVGSMVVSWSGLVMLMVLWSWNGKILSRLAWATWVCVPVGEQPANGNFEPRSIHPIHPTKVICLLNIRFFSLFVFVSLLQFILGDRLVIIDRRIICGCWGLVSHYLEDYNKK